MAAADATDSLDANPTLAANDPTEYLSDFFTGSKIVSTSMRTQQSHNWGMVALSFAVILTAAMPVFGADLFSLPEHLRPDPFGGIVAADRLTGAAPARRIELDGTRAAYASFQLVASVPEGGEYRLELTGFPAESGLQIELYREWFHFLPATKQYYPDALIPVKPPYAARIPDADNRVAGQTAQGFWVDIWIPANARPGSYEATATLKASGRSVSLPVTLKVIPATVPNEDVVAIDHNSYGTSWLATQYPTLRNRLGENFYTSDEFFELLHSLHRIFYEHRGVFHQLGYGHGGKVGPEFAPRLEGSGKNKHIADWNLYDRHYGPLFDGSAFASTRRGARPIPYAYLPINPEWPASFLWWGEPGYEREFVNVVSEMEHHFREKGWTQTRLEMFFNHKKRYKAFNWDGDEVRFTRDYEYFKEYGRLLKEALPADTPVKFVTRADVSWTMERQFKELAGVVNFWVSGTGELAWFKDTPAMLKARGDIVFSYGGTPPLDRPSSHITEDVLRPWLWGTDGFVRWQTVDPGADPWYQFGGGGETLIYPGDRFGIAGPVASIRLKIQRNAVQDVTLLDTFRKKHALGALRAEAAKRFNQTTVDEWWSTMPDFFKTHDPLDWTNADYPSVENQKFTSALDAAAWQRVREYVLELAREAQ